VLGDGRVFGCANAKAKFEIEALYACVDRIQ
jgi:hypothetical protein